MTSAEELANELLFFDLEKTGNESQDFVRCAYSQ